MKIGVLMSKICRHSNTLKNRVWLLGSGLQSLIMLSEPPPSCFGDWCYCQPETPNTCLTASSPSGMQPQEDPNFSGMPPEFEQWCKTSWLPSNLGRSFYCKQAETHIQGLATKIGNLQRQNEEQAGGLLEQRDERLRCDCGCKTNWTTLRTWQVF